jgi:hypothetical protein
MKVFRIKKLSQFKDLPLRMERRRRVDCGFAATPHRLA